MSAKRNSGRKKVSAIWNYFTFNNVINKSTCKSCDYSLSKGNPTNLMTHLRTQHKELYNKFEAEEKERKRILSLSSSRQSNMRVAGTGLIKIEEAFKKKPPQCWSVNSEAYRCRMDALMELFSTTGIPISSVDQLGFRNYSQLLDPKFKLPRQYMSIFYNNYYIKSLCLLLR